MSESRETSFQELLHLSQSGHFCRSTQHFECRKNQRFFHHPVQPLAHCLHQINLPQAILAPAYSAKRLQVVCFCNSLRTHFIGQCLVKFLSEYIELQRLIDRVECKFWQKPLHGGIHASEIVIANGRVLETVQLIEKKSDGRRITYVCGEVSISAPEPLLLPRFDRLQAQLIIRAATLMPGQCTT